MSIDGNNTTMNGESLNVSEKRKQELKQLFPGVFTETKNDNGKLRETIDFERLKAELGEFSEVYDNRRERYGMEWPGKKDCLRLLQEPSRATLKPCRAESVDFDTTENLFIEGDNLEVLKLLQKSYYGQVKMIYIDPPYNTGKEFIYPDNFTENLDTYLEYAGLKESGGAGRKWSTNSANEGRFHTKWLNMMFPRLYLARNLLREDGVIFISIDDNEVENLRRLCNEIFGEENFVACLVWDKNRKNDAKYFSVGHEYMLVYFKNEQALREQGTILRIEKEGVAEIRDLFEKSLLENNGDLSKFKTEYIDYCNKIPKGDDREPIKRFKKIDTKGPYRDDGNINWPGGGGPNYEVLHPITQKVCKAPVSGWRYPTIERFIEEYEKGRIVFGDDETTVPRVRTNLFENSEQVLTSVNFSYAQTATNEFVSLFDGERVFENPKPVSDIEKLIRYMCKAGDTVLDFFGGSSTTAHATLLAKKRIKANIKFISVQLPEKCDIHSVAFKNGFQTIADISKERIRRASHKIHTELESQSDFDKTNLPDLGFKVLKLDKSNFKQWQAPGKDISDEALLQQMELLVEHIEPTASQEDLLYELLIKAGVMPTEQIKQIDLAGHQVFSVADNSLVVHLGDNIDQACIDAVLQLAPGQFICLDKAFHGNDQLKTNAVKSFAAFNQGKEKIDQIDFKTV